MTRTTRRSLLVCAVVGAAAAGAVLIGCSQPPTTSTLEVSEPGAAAFPVSITDDASRTVDIAAEPQRIVSLAPANTEMLFAIGAGDRVVGVTSYDDYPAEVADIEKVGDFAGPNMEAVAAADPDLVVATTGVQADAITKLEELGATVIAIDPATLDGLYEDIAELGQATGQVAEAQTVVDDMRTDVAAVEEAVSGLPEVTTFLEIGQNPLFTVGKGTLIDELITTAGGANIVTESGYVPYSTEQLVASDPAVYMATLGSMSDPAELEKRAGFSKLSAVEDGRVFVLEDNYVSRPGPRVVVGLKQIAEALHPEAFDR